jgi:F0F1-type ATP synthase delta subunit
VFLINMEELILSDFFTTKSQANNFLTRLNYVSEKIYESDFNLDSILHEQFGTKKTDKFISLLRDNNVSPGSSSALNNFINHLQEIISSRPIANITFAIEPNEQILKSVSDWFLLNLKKQVLIEPEINPDLIAGAAVSFQGKRLDSSIKSIFEQVCTNIFNGTPVK